MHIKNKNLFLKNVYASHRWRKESARYKENFFVRFSRWKSATTRGVEITRNSFAFEIHFNIGRRRGEAPGAAEWEKYRARERGSHNSKRSLNHRFALPSSRGSRARVVDVSISLRRNLMLLVAAQRRGSHQQVLLARQENRVRTTKKKKKK